MTSRESGQVNSQRPTTNNSLAVRIPSVNQISPGLTDGFTLNSPSPRNNNNLKVSIQ